MLPLAVLLIGISNLATIALVFGMLWREHKRDARRVVVNNHDLGLDRPIGRGPGVVVNVSGPITPAEAEAIKAAWLDGRRGGPSRFSE